MRGSTLKLLKFNETFIYSCDQKIITFLKIKEINTRSNISYSGSWVDSPDEKSLVSEGYAKIDHDSLCYVFSNLFLTANFAFDVIQGDS
jgi:hypothetical protein